MEREKNVIPERIVKMKENKENLANCPKILISKKVGFEKMKK